MFPIQYEVVGFSAENLSKQGVESFFENCE
jgi:hypothetical protein